jgi:hypothetical protein
MRKKSKRIVRPSAKPLTPKQRSDIIIGPRIHLHQLLSQHYDISYICSVAGVFNIAGILALQLERADLQPHFEAAQELILKLIHDKRAPTEEEAPLLRDAFNIADEWLSIQNTADLTRALIYSDREVAKGNTIQRC